MDNTRSIGDSIPTARKVSPLRQRIIDDMSVRHLAPNTMTAYLKLEAAPSFSHHVIFSTMYGAGMQSVRQQHRRREYAHAVDLPLVLAGYGAGQIKGSRSLRYPANTPMTNLLLAMLDKAGVQTEKIGDSTGEVTSPMSNGEPPACSARFSSSP